MNLKVVRVKSESWVRRAAKVTLTVDGLGTTYDGELTIEEDDVTWKSSSGRAKSVSLKEVIDYVKGKRATRRP